MNGNLVESPFEVHQLQEKKSRSRIGAVGEPCGTSRAVAIVAGGHQTSLRWPWHMWGAWSNLLLNQDFQLNEMEVEQPTF